MHKSQIIAPEHTAVRVALWRALHVKIDPAPHIFTDTIGEKIVGEENWESRPDMNPDFSKSMRASIVGRARFIEDTLLEQTKHGVNQYVILGAGLDTFAFRRKDLKNLEIFEVDQPGPQTWKRQRLSELRYTTPSNLHFVPVDFEAGQSWWDELLSAGFDTKRPAVIVSTGVSMYLSRKANSSTLSQLSKLAPGSTFIMTFMMALHLLDERERSIMEYVMKNAAAANTPFLSLFTPDDVLTMAQECGFQNAAYVSALDIFNRYFAQRNDDLNAGHAEAFLVATT